MTNNKGPWILIAIAIGVLALSFFAGRWTSSDKVEVGVGAPGTRAGIEEYIPYIKYNDGYYSLLGITTTADLSAAGGTFSGNISAVAGAFSGAVSTGLLTSGGGVTATSSTGAGTLTAANLFGGSILEHTNTGATTLTLPASTTITAYIPTAGQCMQVFYKNKGTGIDTLAGGSGTLLRVASSTIAVGLKTVLAGGVSPLTLCRTSNTDVEVYMSPAI